MSKANKQADRDRLNALPLHSILTLTETAILLDCDTSTVSALIKCNKLTASQIGRSFKITKQAIVDLVDSGYSFTRRKLQVIDGGKTKRGKQPCPSTNAVKRGISTIPMHTEQEYAKALERK